MVPIKHCEKTFYGTTLMSDKGQIVVPVAARRALDLKNGEQLLVFALADDTLAITKLASVERFAHELTKKLSKVKTLIRQVR